MMASDEVRLARAYLCGVAEPPAPALAALVAVVGPLEAAARVRQGQVPERVAKETGARCARELAAEQLRAAEAVGARLLVPEDDDWPLAALLAFSRSGYPHLAAPLALWVRGTKPLAPLTERSVAVVGSRACTGYGSHVANSLGFGVAELGVTVFSGAAFGIDGAAHRGALSAGGPTVAVLACGVDIAYPAGHHRLLAQIVEEGLVVSEYPPGTTPARHRFLVRNRVIAGLSAGTVVVEAGWRSGSRRTASDALLLGRSVMAVPGPVTSALSVGSHRLLREPGVTAVTTAAEVVEEIGRIGIDLAEPSAPRERPTDNLHHTTARVYDVLDQRSNGDVRRLGVESGLPVELVRAALGELELAGLAERTPNGWRRAPASPKHAGKSVEGCGGA
ncbi:MAG TPA: DNA-processing protein DprA [Pseudonocardia sp.]|jgi:DNA processing protein|uniref:DNA-processing protein DprA n=1 Tax=Pseudonocardia sp. TaxID=60912 RepID=UPI002F3FCDEF